MNRPKLLRQFGPDTFNAPVVCKGEQLAAVLSAIDSVCAELQWFVADIDLLASPPIFGERTPTPILVGNAAALVSAVSPIVQVLRGVFAGVPNTVVAPRFRNGGMWTEDEEDADIGDAVAMLRSQHD